MGRIAPAALVFAGLTAPAGLSATAPKWTAKGAVTSIAALSATSITAGRGPMSLTCTLGDGSPDVSGLRVGDALREMRCRNGVLTRA